MDTLEKVDLTPAPTFMPISYGQDSSASATTSVLGAVVGALLVGVLIIFILRRKSKAEALEKAALFRQNQVCLFPLPSNFLSFFFFSELPGWFHVELAAPRVIALVASTANPRRAGM